MSVKLINSLLDTLHFTLSAAAIQHQANGGRTPKADTGGQAIIRSGTS